MSIQFDLKDTRAELHITDGVAAFDPITLQIAGQTISDANYTVHAASELAGKLPQTLSNMADIQLLPPGNLPLKKVVVTIDTGTLTWDMPQANVHESSFLDYRDNE